MSPDSAGWFSRRSSESSSGYRSHHLHFPTVSHLRQVTSPPSSGPPAIDSPPSWADPAYLYAESPIPPAITARPSSTLSTRWSGTRDRVEHWMTSIAESKSCPTAKPVHGYYVFPSYSVTTSLPRSISRLIVGPWCNGGDFLKDGSDPVHVSHELAPEVEGQGALVGLRQDRRSSARATRRVTSARRSDGWAPSGGHHALDESLPERGPSGLGYLPFVPRREMPFSARLGDALGVGVAAPRGVTLGCQQHVLGQGGQRSVTQRAAIDGCRQVLGPTDRPPAHGLVVHPGQLATTVIPLAPAPTARRAFRPVGYP